MKKMMIKYCPLSTRACEGNRCTWWNDAEKKCSAVVLNSVKETPRYENHGKYKIVAIMGKSGSGKNTILKRLEEADNSYHKIVSCTTRPMRKGEQEGVDYYYYPERVFAQKIINDEILEARFFNNWCYGTSIESVVEDKVNVGVFNPESIEDLLSNPDVEVLKVFYVTVPDTTRLIRQLCREDTPDTDEIIRRYQTDNADFQNLPFSYTVLNNLTLDDLTAAVDEIKKFLDRQV